MKFYSNRDFAILYGISIVQHLPLRDKASESREAQHNAAEQARSNCLQSTGTTSML